MKTNHEKIAAAIAQLGKFAPQVRAMGEAFGRAAEALGRAAHAFQSAQRHPANKSHTT